MKKEYMLVFTNPLEGKEEAFNRWYTEVHMPEAMQIAGFVAAQRFKVGNSPVPAPEHKYLAIYEAPTGQMQQCVEKLFAASDKMTMENVIDLDNTKLMVFESITDLITAK